MLLKSGLAVTVKPSSLCMALQTDLGAIQKEVSVQLVTWAMSCEAEEDGKTGAAAQIPDACDSMPGNSRAGVHCLKILYGCSRVSTRNAELLAAHEAMSKSSSPSGDVLVLGRQDNYLKHRPSPTIVACHAAAFPQARQQKPLSLPCQPHLARTSAICNRM